MLQEFEKRRDRFELFNNFEKPLLNITFNLEVPNFRDFCKKEGLPPFHFFLYALFKSLHQIENFRYRICGGEVILIDEFIPSYTVMNKDSNLNFTRFKMAHDLEEFIRRSLAAKKESESSFALLHAALELSERELKQYVFITSIPWLDFSSIEHPVRSFKNADIPSISWGKFKDNGKLINMPFSVQAHHGFVDGHHIHLLAKTISQVIDELMTTFKR